MANLLYLVHRMPFPPNKGDKVRSYHLLQHLASRHRVFVGTFVDDPDDEQHVDALRSQCAGLHVERLHPRMARARSLAGLLTGEALSLHYYRSAGLRRWVAQTVEREDITAAVVFSSSMAPYAQAHPQLPMLLDMVDVDSAKWQAYAPRHRWPMSWVYQREAQRLLACERQAAAQSRRCFLATETEADLFRSLAPECAGQVEAMTNGVDTAYFSPDTQHASPFDADEIPLVFTGAMDYWPNVDAVTWFAGQALPQLRARWPRLRLHIVGRAPTPAVRALAADPSAGVVVSGTVPDVRPYLQHAAVVVAPLRLARGIQNKILEAMAMGKPVVAATPCVDALDVQSGREILDAAEPDEYVQVIDRLLRAASAAAAIGVAARLCVQQRYTWASHLAALDRQLAELGRLSARAVPRSTLQNHPVA
ncbi:MAG: TIGR03087 family PEP-CTERM/XrtA system glycosyltransferase [Betaproteobacteria bacterium]|nr:TIGR03087 family PEP-CTERM/XrtA system glycosyltransferase [Betaproteobacteria bacterium]